MNVPPKGNIAFRLGAYFETLKVSQQPIPNLTVRIAEGAYWVGGSTLVEFAGGNTAIMVPPGAGLAVWVLVALTANASVQLVYGVPAATSSPPAPAVPAGFIPLAYVYLTNGMTAVTNDMIFDERPLWVMQTSFVPLAGATMSGPLILSGPPTAANGAATKSYVDTQDALHPTFVDLNNGLLSKADIAGTPSDTFVLNSDWVGAPSTNVFFGVDRGSQPNTYIRWNEGTDLWELTNDGTSYSPIANTAALGAYLPLAGGTMLGALTLFADPAAPLQAATKQYTDAQILLVGNATYVAKAGSTMTGVLVHPAGTAANPTVVFGADVTTGFYSAGAGEIDVAVSGVKKVSFTSAGVTVFSGFFTPGTGGAGAPEHSFTNDVTSGMYRVGAGQVGLSAAGANVATFSATGLAVVGNISATGGLNVTGPATVALDMGGFKVTNMGTPTVGTDATNKTYVDTADALKVNKTDTFALTGDVTVPATSLTGPANSYVATLANTAVTPGAYGSASSVGTFTVDAKGRLTASASTAIAITGAAVIVGGFTLGHVVTLDAAGHPVDSGIASANVFLANGSVTATGNFNLGTHNVSNVDTVSGTIAGNLNVTAQSPVSGTGHAVVITGANAVTSGVGGAVSLTAGNGIGGGGTISLTAGDASNGNAGGFQFNGGNATNGAGGAFVVVCSGGNGVDQNGGAFTVTAGDGTGAGTAGALNLTAGNSDTGTGGNIFIVSGFGGTGQAGGQITIQTADGQLTDAYGGSMLIQVGAALGAANGSALLLRGAGAANGTGGDVNIVGGPTTGTGNAGNVVIVGGTPTAGNGGSVQLTGTNGVGTNKNGGSVSIVAGNATGVGTNGSVQVAVFAGTSFQATGLGSVAVGLTAPLTTATDGFPYVPVISGPPTGAPTAIAGFTPLVVEDHAGTEKLWLYSASTPTIGWNAISTAVQTKVFADSPYALVDGDIILVNATAGAFSALLPATPRANQKVIVKKIDATANTVTVDGNGHTIDGAATFVLTTQYDAVTVVSDGTNWYVI